MLDACGRRPAALRGALQAAAQREHHPRGGQLPVAAPPRAPRTSASASTRSTARCARSTTTPAATSPRAEPTPTTPRCASSSSDCAPAPRARSPARRTRRTRRRSSSQVRRIIERFRGREGTTELDRRWTRKVTDVRNWFMFSASERWREDDTRARALLRLGRQVRRPEGEARLHGAGGEPRLPVRAGVGRSALALVPLRGDRRGVRARLGRVGALRPGAVRAAGPAAADRHAAAEDPRHRAVRRRRRLRAQRGGRQSQLRNLTIEEYRASERRAPPQRTHDRAELDDARRRPLARSSALGPRGGSRGSRSTGGAVSACALR